MKADKTKILNKQGLAVFFCPLKRLSNSVKSHYRDHTHYDQYHHTHYNTIVMITYTIKNLT